MGGGNFQPVTEASLEPTVPATQALSGAMSCLHEGNQRIEDMIRFGGDADEARQHRQGAIDAFDDMVQQLGLAQLFITDTVVALNDSDFDPFGTHTFATETFVAQAISAELLPDANVVHRATIATRRGRPSDFFLTVQGMVDTAVTLVTTLHESTKQLAWGDVEANRSTWYRDFMRVNTAMQDALTFWCTGGMISTEVWYQRTEIGSLFDHTTVRA